jgi:uncharacterized membrane protein YccC
MAKAKDAKATKPAKASGKQPLTSLSEHASAGPAIRRAKAIGGLVGFALAVLLGLRNGQPFASLMLRALELGFTGYLVAWAAAVAVWRRVLTAQATTAVREVQEARRRRLAVALGEETAE